MGDNSIEEERERVKAEHQVAIDAAIQETAQLMRGRSQSEMMEFMQTDAWNTVVGQAAELIDVQRNAVMAVGLLKIKNPPPIGVVKISSCPSGSGFSTLLD